METGRTQKYKKKKEGGSKSLFNKKESVLTGFVKKRAVKIFVTKFFTNNESPFSSHMIFALLMLICVS